MKIIRVRNKFEVVNENNDFIKEFNSFDDARVFLLGDKDVEYDKGSVDLFGIYDAGPSRRKYSKNRAKYRKTRVADIAK